MTDEQHNRYIAYAFIAHGGFQFLLTLLMGVIFYIFISLPMGPGDHAQPPVFLGVFFAAMLLIQALFAAPSFLAAYALLTRKGWARIAGIVAAVLASMHVPIGTGACIYALWFFLGENWRNVYPVATGDRAARQLSNGEPISWASQSAEDFNFQEGRTTPPDWR